MKRYMNIPLAIAILAGVLVVSAHAQTSSAQRVIANVPFSFTVGKTTMPAGKYTITVLNPTSDRRILQVRSTDGHASAMVPTTSVIKNVSDNAKLVFERYGDQYFFAQAQMPGDSTGLAAVRSKSERNDKTLARMGKKSVITIVAE
jgi:hypothetical protein